MDNPIIERLADTFVGIVCGGIILCAVLQPVVQRVRFRIRHWHGPRGIL